MTFVRPAQRPVDAPPERSPGEHDSGVIVPPSNARPLTRGGIALKGG